ncbi:MAG: hypothetical protein QF486_00280 [Candidatus Woesearchaeota archaeon]|jgi:hypothetical protein|nr:hypothetical protein [Candidatus Woesearchaeota archaeon]MDP7198041.1 hypothetical protein [Candidatus Woesearchaeota archaeon]MDP7466875.1 hypothetical protein [Candidatus Woesearchaeota archaeon]MDP7647311.1 hypothetical protein [Candidatus Woesearchaeota archaeon]|tara:strand:+ start:139 stop:570 length:432 start_codon:yes stop_codon:yes gene_type:complete
MDERRLIVIGIAAVIAIAAITIVGTQGMFESSITGNVVASQDYNGQFGIYQPGFRSRVIQRPGDLSYQQRTDLLARQATSASRRLNTGARSRYGAYVPSGPQYGGVVVIEPTEVEPTRERYGYSPYLDRATRYDGYYVQNEFS